MLPTKDNPYAEMPNEALAAELQRQVKTYDNEAPGADEMCFYIDEDAILEAARRLAGVPCGYESCNGRHYRTPGTGYGMTRCSECESS